MNRLLLSLAALALPACITDPATGKTVFDKAKTGRILEAAGKNILTDAGKLAVGALEGAVMSAASGDRNTADLQQAAATGAWKSVGTIDVATDIGNIITAWNAGSAPAVAQAATNVYATINPQTDQQKKDAVNLIATTISTAATSPSTGSGASTPKADGKAVKPLGANGSGAGRAGSGAGRARWRMGPEPDGRYGKGPASIAFGGSVLDSRQSLGREDAPRTRFENAPWQVALREMPPVEVAR